MPFCGLAPKRLAAFLVFAVAAGSTSVGFAQKEAMYASINQRDEAAWQSALAIWGWSEPGYQEQNSSALLAKTLEDAGFTVQRGVAGMPTAFTATAGSGRPVIGILGEFDALPGLSQEALPYRQPRPATSWGHGCGHHLLGMASSSAAIAVAEQIAAGNLHGTIRYYGCPAEEGGGAKVFMVRAGLVDDCDAVLHWHPSADNSAGDRSSMARIAVKFRFKGKPAHSAGAPDQGRSALDAVELTNHAAELLREHTPDFTRIHHVITAGGDAPNIVPEFTEVYYYVRHPKADVVRSLYKRLLLCAEAGAHATETQLEVRFEGGIMEILPNNTLGQVALANLTAQNNLEYTSDELAFVTRIQESLESPKPVDSIKQVADRSGAMGKGSTDVGDISWVVPTTGFTTACWAPGTPGHSWQATAAGGTTIGRKGMNLAARVLAAMCWDLLSNPQLLQAAKDEQLRLLGEKKYEPLMPADQPPPLEYRKPPRNE